MALTELQTAAALAEKLYSNVPAPITLKVLRQSVFRSRFEIER